MLPKGLRDGNGIQDQTSRSATDISPRTTVLGKRFSGYPHPYAGMRQNGRRGGPTRGEAPSPKGISPAFGYETRCFTGLETSSIVQGQMQRGHERRACLSVLSRCALGYGRLLQHDLRAEANASGVDGLFAYATVQRLRAEPLGLAAETPPFLCSLIVGKLTARRSRDCRVRAVGVRSARRFPLATNFVARPSRKSGGLVRACPYRSPSGADEALGDAGLHNNTGNKIAPLVSPFHARP